MHGSHLGICVVGIAAAVGLVVLTGGSAGGAGLLVAALACPLAMVIAMRVLMGDRHGGCGHDHRQPGEQAELPRSDGVQR